MRPSSISTFFIIMLNLLAFSSVSYADTEIDCSFRTLVTTSEYGYSVSSEPAESCEKQVLKISVLKQGKSLIQFVNPTEAIVEKAWAEDINDDGNFELLVLSRKNSEPSRQFLEIYTVDGSILKQVRFPDPDSMTGYRGGDRFSVENGRIVRVFPLYLQNDAVGKPTGGERRVLYQYRNREALLVGGQETAKSVEPPKVQNSVKSRNARLIKLKSIIVKKDYIEINADGSIENFKTTRIDDPWRLIIDIPGASSDIQDKEVAIGSLGISKVRIGTHKDHIRLVFDSEVSPLPIETITQAENALRVGFYKSQKK